MEVRVNYTETWKRSALLDLTEADLDQIREWAPGKEITPALIQEWLESCDYDGMGVSEPWVTGNGRPHPGRIPDNGVPGVFDRYEENELDSVEIWEGTKHLAFAVSRGFSPAATSNPTWHFAATATGYIAAALGAEDIPVIMACGVEVILPDRPKMTSFDKICPECVTATGVKRQ